MGAYGWRTSHPVAEWLKDQGYRFNFFQAIRLLEQVRPDSAPLGEGADPLKEAVRLRSNVDLTFPASQIQHVRTADGKAPKAEGPRPEMMVNFLGLAGFMGPLPMPFSALVLERSRMGDTGPQDFLDIFNHRLLSITYRIRREHRIGFDRGSPELHRFANYLFAMLGLGLPTLRDGMDVPDRAVLRYAGLLTQTPRSLAGLSTMLADFFRVKVEARPFRGAFRALDPSQQTAIGVVDGKNQRLGQAVVLGERIWDQHAGFTLRVGPVGYGQYLDFLPSGAALTALCQMTRFYLGPSFDFAVRVRVRAAEIQPAGLCAGPTSATTVPAIHPLRCALSCCVAPAAMGPRLGWTSWLQGTPEGVAPGDSGEGELEMPMAVVPHFQQAPHAGQNDLDTSPGG